MDNVGAGRQNHSLRSFILAPSPATTHTRTLGVISMQAFYLTEDKKELYCEALEYAKNCNCLDPGVYGYLAQINTSPNVRTMFSKLHRLRSYLVVCFSKEVEAKIMNEIIPNLKATIEQRMFCKFKFYHHLSLPHPAVANGHECSKYTDDPSYWNIHLIWFDLDASTPADHEFFWTTVSNSLSSV